jgi:hypothetical protein
MVWWLSELTVAAQSVLGGVLVQGSGCRCRRELGARPAISRAVIHGRFDLSCLTEGGFVSRPGSGSSVRLIGGVVGGRMAFELGSVMEPDSRRFVAFTSTLAEACLDEEVGDIEL